MPATGLEGEHLTVWTQHGSPGTRFSVRQVFPSASARTPAGPGSFRRELALRACLASIPAHATLTGPAAGREQALDDLDQYFDTGEERQGATTEG
ncbi:hypothetical protein ABH925_005188 [Streptacidiphilus sp. EB129]